MGAHSPSQPIRFSAHAFDLGGRKPAGAENLTNGYSAALLGAAGIAAAAAVLAALTINRRHAIPATAETDTAPAAR